MNGYEFLAYGASAIAIIVAAGAIIPNPFRDKIRDTLSILTFGLLKSATSEIQRAELRVAQLSAELKRNEDESSKITGKANHEKNKLKTLEGALKTAEDNLSNAMGDKSGKFNEKDINELTDKVGEAEEDVNVQKAAVDDITRSADAVRLAVVKSAKELKALARLVQSKAVRDQATKALDTASGILKATKEFSNATSEISHDLDKIDERYEQAKQRFEDAQGSETDKKVEEAKEQAKRDEIKKRMEERAKNGGK